jgi:hypothetical protein
MKLKSVFSYIDAAALFLIITIVLYFLGYVYYSSFFGVYGVDIGFFTLPFESYILVNWWYDLIAVGSLVLVYFFYGLIDFDSNKFLHKHPKARKFIYRNALSLTLMAIFMVVLFAAIAIDKNARNDALYKARSRKKVEFTLKTGTPPPKTSYFLTYSSGKYIVYSDVPVKEGEQAKGQIHVINDDDVSSVTFPPD